MTAAQKLGKERLALLMETVCATGIRVSEVRYITVAALRCGKAQISLKGKIRTILIPNKLCHKLLKYVRKQKIASGEIFCTNGGKSLSRRQIWAEMKGLCRYAVWRNPRCFHTICGIYLQRPFTWTDNTPDKWYYRDVQEATNSHDYHRTGVEVSDGTIQYAFEYEKWDKVVEAPDWAALEKTWSTANSLR